MNIYKAKVSKDRIEITNQAGEVVLLTPSRNPVTANKVMWYVIGDTLYFVTVDVSTTLLPMWNKAMSTLQQAIRSQHNNEPLKRYGFGTLNYSFYNDQTSCMVNIGADPVLQIELDADHNFSAVSGIPISHRGVSLENTPIYDKIQTEVSEYVNKRTLN